MSKGYSDRQMSKAAPEREYFFPKANPPQTVKARTRKDAEKKLKATNNKDNE